MKRITTAACVLLLAASAFGQAGSWQPVGKAGDYQNTIAGVGIGSTLYTIETSGALYAVTVH